MDSVFVAPPDFTTRPTLLGRFSGVSSTHWLATASAQAVLEGGGNAFDAAMAGAFVLHVVEPHLNGPGGDLVALVASTGASPEILMGQGSAPAGASIEHFLAEELDRVPGAGGLAAAVPGAVPAWLELLAQRGTWELPAVLSYAIDFARYGHPLGARVSATLTAVQDLFTDHWPSSAAHWLPEGAVPTEGDTVRNEAYARTLERLIGAATGATREERVRAAAREWSHGFVANAATGFLQDSHRHSSGTSHRAVITPEDFAAFQSSFEPAVTLTFRGHKIHKSGPWGQGPVLLQTLAILDGFEDQYLDPSTELGAHTIVEALKLAMADRDAYYGDARSPSSSLLTTLLSPEYAATRRAQMSDAASSQWRPGEISGHQPYRPPLLTATEFDAAHGQAGEGSVGEPTVSLAGETRGDTCHLAVADRWGNFVAATPSGGWLQSSPHIPELGFCLGTRLQMMWLDPQSPSALVPGARPRTTLTPTMVTRGSEVVAALGSPGGDQQDQWQLLYLLRTLVGGYTPQQAIDAPALHTTALVGSFWPRTWEPAGMVVEGRFPADVVAGLRARGHIVTTAGDWALGRLCVVGRDGEYLYAAANPRGAQGYAASR